MKNGWLISIAIIFLSIVAGWGISTYLHLSKMHLPTPSNAIIYVLAIDMNGDNKISTEDILSGHDSVLAIHLNQLPARLLEQFPELKSSNNAQDAYVFNGLSSLARFDLDHDHEIDAENSVYQALELLTFRNKTEVEGDNAYAVGLRVVLLNPNFLVLEANDDPARFTIPPATAVMSDNSTRVIHVIPMDAKVFENITLHRDAPLQKNLI